jgi:hypothetical protein
VTMGDTAATKPDVMNAIDDYYIADQRASSGSAYRNLPR